jgi:hypothetical protein
VNWSGGTFNNGNFVGRQIDYINLSTPGSYIEYYPSDALTLHRSGMTNQTPPDIYNDYPQLCENSWSGDYTYISNSGVVSAYHDYFDILGGSSNIKIAISRIFISYDTFKLSDTIYSTNILINNISNRTGKTYVISGVTETFNDSLDVTEQIKGNYPFATVYSATTTSISLQNNSVASKQKSKSIYSLIDFDDYEYTTPVNMTSRDNYIIVNTATTKLIVNYDIPNFGFRIYPSGYTNNLSNIFTNSFYLLSANTDLIDYFSEYDRVSLFYLTDTNDYKTFYISGLTTYLYQNVDYYYEYKFPISNLNSDYPDFQRQSIQYLDVNDIIAMQINYSGLVYDVSVQSKIVDSLNINLTFKSPQKIRAIDDFVGDYYTSFISNIRILYKNRSKIEYSGNFVNTNEIMEYVISGLSYKLADDGINYTYINVYDDTISQISFFSNRSFYIDKLIKNSASKWYDGKFYNNYFEAYWYGGYFEGGDWNGYNKIYNDFRKPPKSSTQLYKNNLIDNKYRI